MGVIVPGAAVAREVIQERVRQDAKWGEQNHPDGTGDLWNRAMAQMARNTCDQAARAGAVTWADILREEFCEVLAESDPAKLREELIQVAAVCAAWVECIDRREA